MTLDFRGFCGVVGERHDGAVNVEQTGEGHPASIPPVRADAALW